jgi:subtilisin family serine protease
VARVAPGATLVSSKVIQENNAVSGSDLVRAVDDILAKAQSIRQAEPLAGIILTMSLSFDGRWAPIEHAIEQAYAAGAASVVAAGNNALSSCSGGVSPQAARFSVAVASLQEASVPTLSPFSNYGECTFHADTTSDAWCEWTLPQTYDTYEEAAARCYDEGVGGNPCLGVYNKQCLGDTFYLCQSTPQASLVNSCVHAVAMEKTIEMYAPGSNIWSASHENDDAYKHLSGTSMAAPHVTGVLALLMQESPDARNLHHVVEQRLLTDSCRAERAVVRPGGGGVAVDACVLSADALGKNSTHFVGYKRRQYAHVHKDTESNDAAGVVVLLLLLCAIGSCYFE